MPMDASACLQTLVRRLLSERNGQGHWEGELASSALSTATALFALLLAQDESRRDETLVRGGLRWLSSHRNSDGGWGDTVRSASNISTTALVWAALSTAGEGDGDLRSAAEAADAWMASAAGENTPKRIADAVRRRYGKDRTFSVPILTMLALAGRLGPGVEGWRTIPQLPFELAALPRSCFRWLRLPVVSYALPALISMGQARHRLLPSRNPLARLARNACRERTLRILREIQPRSGGFLEAVPLTSFVIMSLVASGRRDHPAVAAGADFLRLSARADGSWPIDTNLATWVTTLSVNALAHRPEFALLLSGAERKAILDWLLGQQYRVVHPFTGAEPGGWAWTDKRGGVPDADDTAGALLALRNLAADDERSRQSAAAGIQWLLDLQNRDGGMPTFCRGWGALPFDRSSPDLTAHALSAWASWKSRVTPALGRRMKGAVCRSLDYLKGAQREDGAWIPLWFGNENAAGEENPTYGTSRVLEALATLETHGMGFDRDLTGSACRWLQSAQNRDGGWGGAPGSPSSIEETSLALGALAANTPDWPGLESGAGWLIRRTHNGEETPAAPIGMYFAKLWYSEKLYPLIFAVSGLSRYLNARKFKPENRRDGIE